MRRFSLNSAALMSIGIVLLACGSPRQREAAHLEQGKKLFQQHDYASAVLEFKKAAQAVPLDAEPYYQEALVHLASGDFRLAVRRLNHAIELNPKHGRAQLKLAELMATSSVSRDVREAKSRILEFLKSEPDDMEAIRALAAADWKLGLTADSEAHLTTALQKFPQNLQATALLAKLRVLNKDIAGAEEALQKAAQASPSSIPVLMALAEFYSLTGRANDAEGYFRRVLQVDANHAAALLDLAALKKVAGQTAEAEATYRRVAALPGPQHRAVHAVFLIDSDRTAEAIPELEQLWRSDKSDRGVRSLLVSAYTETGRVTEAENIVTQALQTNPKDFAAYFQRSLMHLRVGRLADAQTDLAHVMAMQPNSAQAHLLQAMLHRRGGALKAEQHELAEAVRLQPDLLEARLELARVLVRNGSAQAALDLLDAAVTLQKSSAAWIAQRNWALFLIGEPDPLRKGIQDGLALGRTPELLVQDALFQLRQGKTIEAQKAIDEALQQNPADKRALNLWMRVLTLRGDPEPKIRKFAMQHGSVVQVQQFYGEMLLSSGKREEARAAFLRALASQPDFAAANISLAQMAIQDRKPDDARKYLVPLLSGPSAVRAHVAMAAVEQMQQNIPEAIRHFEAVVSAAPGNVAALNDLAYLLVESGRSTDEALKYAQRAQELAPYNPNVEDTLGWVFYRRGMYSMALQYIRDSLSRQDSPLTKLHLAMACAKSGDLRQGREYLETVKRENPGLPGIDAAQQLMRQ